MPEFSTLAIVLFASSTAQLEDLGVTFMTVGDAGNPAYQLPDERNRRLTRFLDGRGSVDYAFKMSRTEISIGQYVDFVNRFTPGSEQLTSLLEPPVSAIWDPQFLPVGERYSVPAGLENTQVGLEVPQIMMYINWLHNGQTNELSGILNGAYDVATLDSGGQVVLNEQAVRQPDAKFWIPTLDEYLKAAHYDPNKNGEGPGWWDYAHSSDAPPVIGLPGQGDVARGLTNEEVQALTMGESVSHPSLPLELYPDAASPWGILDLLGGRQELIDELDPFDFSDNANTVFDRLIKFADDNSIISPFDNDRLDRFSTRSFTQGFLNTHIVTAIPSPPSVVMVSTAICVHGRRRGRRMCR